MNFISSIQKNICLVLLLAAIPMFVSCDSTSRRTHIDFSTSNVVYKFEEVDRDKPEAHIYPVDPAMYPPNALLMPLPVTQSLGPREAAPISKGVTRMLWQALVREEAFPVLEYAENIPTYSLQQGLALARHKGADLLITGSIPYIIAGGSGGLNQVNIRLDIYDVETCELLWSLAHSGVLASKPSQDYIFFAQKSKLPPDPIYAITMAIGSDLGKVLHKWSYAQEDEEYPKGEEPPSADGMPKTPKEAPAF